MVRCYGRRKRDTEFIPCRLLTFEDQNAAGQVEHEFQKGKVFEGRFERIKLRVQDIREIPVIYNGNGRHPWTHSKVILLGQMSKYQMVMNLITMIAI